MSFTSLRTRTLALIFLIGLGQLAQANTWQQKLDLQLRADDRSSESLRYQYRMRYYPSFQFTDEWSTHSFVVTGDEFGSSHNTLDDGAADYLYMRRLYARHESDYGKTEFGVIPTYKGKVSSTGLSKDGWIKGLRYVRGLQDAKLEFVIGQLDSLDPAKALRLATKIDYLEVEYSATLNERSSFELSVERMTQANFLRTEYRQQMANDRSAFFELVNRLDKSRTKLVLGFDGPFQWLGSTATINAYYAYVSDNFGLRTDLTEDFLGTGHGFSAEISSDFLASGWSWFVRLDATEDRNRFLAGVKWSVFD